jgi:hypothetical protein
MLPAVFPEATERFTSDRADLTQPTRPQLSIHIGSFTQVVLGKSHESLPRAFARRPGVRNQHDLGRVCNRI